MQLTITDILRLANIEGSIDIFSKNPFLKGIILSVEAKGGRQTIQIMLEGRELMSYLKSAIKENTNFVKLYFDGSTFIDSFSELPKAASRVLFAGVFPALHYNAMKVYLDPKILSKDTSIGLKQTAIYAGIKELQRRQFIHKCEDEPYAYYINPRLFFRGEQVSAIISEVKKVTNYNTKISGELVVGRGKRKSKT